MTIIATTGDIPSLYGPVSLNGGSKPYLVSLKGIKYNQKIIGAAQWINL